ncbi:MAG: glycosyl transferase family 1, partial [Nanohaloarchaea archaeon SW_4_43_9]
AEEPDKVVAVSEKLAEEVEDEFDIKPEVVHNGFSEPESSGLDVRKHHDIPEDESIIFFVGRHAEQKGLEHLLYGFKKLLEERDAALVIGGKGHMTEPLKKFTEILGIRDSVVFPGFIPQEELGDYYREADVFVSPSINEPFGLTITEALESGTTVVATENGVEEIAGDSLISTEPDSDSIKEGIEKALEQESRCKHESRSWEEMTEEVIETYRQLSQNS